MEKLGQNKKIYVGASEIPSAERGVFSAGVILSGEIIERCPVIEVSLDDPSNDDKGILVNYYFYFGKGLALALGFGSIYNHSYDPNATYMPKPDEGVIEFKAIRDIAAGEEITTNYNFGNPNDKSQPNVHGVPPPA
ncbi:MAG TPA: SET domain-containing protein-lysine N-methyltransferase [Candidatus Saccharimonadales bacterium]|nr:SET domain-containing protein-lysine N-methyltransferase [Candidatus Saccharimonadales bacterium]